MFSVPCSVSPLQLEKRRSKSLDDLKIKKEYHRNNNSNLDCYKNESSPVSPIVMFDIDKPQKSELPKRRHSLSAEPSSTEYLRLAKIYGWTTTKDTTDNTVNSFHSRNGTLRRLQTSRSFSHISINTGSKFSRMFARRRKSLTSTSASLPILPTANRQKSLKSFLEFQEQSKGIISAIITAKSSSHQTLGCIGVEENNGISEPSESCLHLPSPPIENDPQVYDLLAKDSAHFIHYGKSDNTVTSATVEKLIEKLTKEMDYEFLMDFFLTYRQFLTPIKLCKLLILRFRWALLENTDERRLIRIRTFVVIRHWLTHYWAYDFMSSRTLRFMLCTFLTQLRDHPVILASPRDERIIRNLRSVLKRQRTFHKSSSFDQRLSSLSTSTWRESQQSRSLLFKSGSTSTVGDRSYRKDSAIGLHVSNQSTPPSISLSFLSRSHRLSSSSSTKSSEAWTSKMNSGLKSIKKSIGKISTSSTSHCDHKDGCLCERPIGPTDPTSPLPFHHMFFSRTTIKPDRPFVMRYRSELIAQQFCLIEQSMLQNVTWDELVELRWKKQNSKKRMSSIGTIVNVENIQKTIDEQVGVDQLIGFFNMTCQWVASEIVRYRAFETRVKVIEKFIRIALKCFQHRNYSTLMQILLGLQSPAISSLEKTWQKIDSYEAQIFNDLKELAKPFRNWKNVRDCMTKATEEVAETSAVESVLTNSQVDFKDLDTTHGCIPFLGLYLSDLVFIAELPTFIESIDSDSDVSIDEKVQDNYLCERLHNNLVNYNKFRIAASVVKHVLAFQVLSRAYDFRLHADIYAQLQSMSLLDNSQIRNLSLLCEEQM